MPCRYLTRCARRPKTLDGLSRTLWPRHVEQSGMDIARGIHRRKPPDSGNARGTVPCFRAWSSLFEFSPNMMPGVFSITMRDTTLLIKASKEFLQMSLRMPVPTGVGISNLSVPEDGQRMVEILDQLDYIHPQPSATTNRHAYMYAVGGPNFGPRKTSNAATGLTFLRPRFNHRPADRLAILANLADYEVRLDTVKIEQTFKSLTICLFALAYINGDLSLLVPEVYQASRVQAPIQGPSWILPFPEIITSINTTHFRAGNALILRNPRRYNFSALGAVIPAYIWNVDRAVDFAPIRRKWEPYWKNWTCIQITMSRREDESEEGFCARQIEIRRHVSEGRRVPEALIDSKGPLNWDNGNLSRAFGSSPVAGVQISRILSTARLEQDMGAQWMIGHLFKDILEYLRYKNELPLANSVWHTIRTDCVTRALESGFISTHNHWDALPDNVVDLLQTEEFKSNPWLQLQLDRNNRGTFNQVWLIDRIMRTGEIWVGNYAPITSSALVTAVPVDRAKSLNALGEHDKVTHGNENEPLEEGQSPTLQPKHSSIQGHNEQDHILQKRLFCPSVEEEGFMVAVLSYNDEYRQALTDSLRMSPRARHTDHESLTLPLLTLQTFKLITAFVFRSDLYRVSQKAAAASTKKGNEFVVPTNIPLGAFLTYVLLNNPMFEMKTQDTRLSERVSAFDVDGPCTVATPFDADMERLPRSILRSMDIAWVVEHVDKRAEDSAQDDGENGEGSVNRVGNDQEEDGSESMEGVYGDDESAATVKPDLTSTSEQLLHQTEQEHNRYRHLNNPKGKAKAVDETARFGRDAESYHGDATFRVMNRVRGAWEIMEESWHEYEFV